MMQVQTSIPQHSQQQLLSKSAPLENNSQIFTEPKNEVQISEVLTRTRRKELENALKKAKGDNEIVIQSRLKRKLSKSTRGSAYRGVSKNGKKWQVRNFFIY